MTTTAPSPSNDLRRRRLMRIAAVLLVPALLAAVELALQVRRAIWHPPRGLDVFMIPDADLGYRLRPDFTTPDGMARTNADGIRGDSLHLASSPGSPRILVIGNSCAYGAGVADSAIFSTKLEARLRAGGFDSALVFNAGVGGYNSRQCLFYLERDLGRFSPTHLIVYAGWNDLVTATWPFYVPDMGLGPARSSLRKPAWLKLLEHSRIFWGLRSRWRGFALKTFRADAGTDTWNEAYLSDYRRNLAGMRRWAESRGVRLVFCLLPYDPARYPEKYSEDAFRYTPAGYRRLWERFQEEIRRAAAGHALADLPSAIAGRESELEVIYDYNHLGETGHDLIAKKLEEVLLPTLP